MSNSPRRQKASAQGINYPVNWQPPPWVTHDGLPQTKVLTIKMELQKKQTAWLSAIGISFLYSTTLCKFWRQMHFWAALQGCQGCIAPALNVGQSLANARFGLFKSGGKFYWLQRLPHADPRRSELGGPQHSNASYVFHHQCLSLD